MATFNEARYDELMAKKKKTAKETMEFKRLQAAKHALAENEDLKPSIIQTDNAKDSLSYINIGLIKDNPFQPRVHFRENEIEEMAASIDSTGLKTPITLAEEGGELTLVAGQKRLRAYRLLNEKEQAQGLKEYEMKYLTIPALVGKGIEALDLLAGALVENTGRENPFVIDTANAIAEHFRLMKEKAGGELSQSEYARTAGISFGIQSRSVIAKYLAVAKLDKALQEIAIEAGLNSLGALYHIAKSDTPKDEKIAAIKAAASGEKSVRDFEEEARSKAGEGKEEIDEIDVSLLPDEEGSETSESEVQVPDGLHDKEDDDFEFVPVEEEKDMFAPLPLESFVAKTLKAINKQENPAEVAEALVDALKSTYEISE